MRVLKALATRLLQRTAQGPVLDHAALLGFYLMLAVAPFCLVLAGIASVLPLEKPLTRAWERAAPLMPAQVHELVGDLFADMLARRSAALLTLGTVVALWSCSRGVNVLRKVLNDAHGVAEERPAWRVQALAVGFTALSVLGAVMPLALFLVAQDIARELGATWPRWWRGVTLPTLAFVLWSLMTVLYRRLPAQRPPWRAAALGALFGTALFFGAGWGFSRWVDTFGNYGVSHGSLATVTVLLLWLYAVSVAFVLGSEVSAGLTPATAPRG